MNTATRGFLVLLRLVIGWHILVEGVEKLESFYRGPTETKKPWTSETYLREATGPLAGYFRDLVGDPDKLTLARATLLPEEAGRSLADRLPPALAAEWDDYARRLAAHYKVEGEQLTRLKEVLRDQKAEAAQWLATAVKPVVKAFPSGSVTVEQSVPERLADYQAKLAELRDLLERELPSFEQPVAKARLAALKAEVARVRTGLTDDLKDLTDRMKAKLQTVLTPEQKQLPAFDEQARPWYEPRRIELIDRSVAYGLTAVGLGLLLGLFTRTACLGGALFLLLFYLAMPALPGVPDNPRAEGHYLFVNKNIIEMVALLALATVPSGRWLGLDGLLHYLGPGRRRPLPPKDRNG
jgi:uncharacterized membrane protein YphA (DoxX/SURF4 family)